MTSANKPPKVDFKFEIAVIPVSDVDRAKEFYTKLGWRLDADFAGSDDWRVIQFTPPGSPRFRDLRQERHRSGARLRARACIWSSPTSKPPAKTCSVAASRSVKRSTPPATRISAMTSPICSGGCATMARTRARQLPFLRLVQRSRRQWLAAAGSHRAIAGTHRCQDTTFASQADLAAAFRRAAAAHGEHEKRNGGQHDVNWPDWYADYIVKEQAGQPLPQ